MITLFEIFLRWPSLKSVSVFQIKGAVRLIPLKNDPSRRFSNKTN